MLSLIEAKRDGRVLTPAELTEMTRSFTAGRIPDYQMAAFLMAVYFRGLNRDETTALTLAMRDSGDVLGFPRGSRPLVDKHSTGGVGDKVSLPLAPLLACLGFRVPMISGRGLGITGGTLDKLDAIPGFKTQLPAEQIHQIVERVGCVICGQTARMVPADKMLYALRDVTGTVPSQALIVASILSKKLAEGLEALVLDVKFGSAAFMRTEPQARELAQAMVDLGNQCGVRTRALLTRMDAPLGRAAGNWLEVKESVEVLEGKGNAADLKSLVLACAGHLLVETGRSASVEEGIQTAEACLASGAPRAKWDEMLEAQGADLDAFAGKLREERTAAGVLEVPAAAAGFVASCDARVIGEVVRDLGGGRQTKDAVIDYGVGIDRLRKPGDSVERGDALARIHAGSREAAQGVLARVAAAFAITPEPPGSSALLAGVIG